MSMCKRQGLQELGKFRPESGRGQACPRQWKSMARIFWISVTLKQMGCYGSQDSQILAPEPPLIASGEDRHVVL